MMIVRTLLLWLILPMALFAQSDNAYLKYKEAEHAPTPELRKQAFNEALALYLRMESDAPSSLLCLNIANAYYQLNEYGFAILYYNKALKEDPRNELAKSNLQIALNKAGLEPDERNLFQKYILFFHYQLSHNEKAVILFLLLFTVFGLFSVHLWIPQLVVKKVAILFLWLFLALFSSLLWVEYLSSPQAVIMRTIALRRDAGEEYASISANPVLSGTKVVVVSVDEKAHWLKVRLPSGEEGYISKEYARII